MRKTANINVQVEPDQRELMRDLVQLTNCETQSQFMRQLLGRLSVIVPRDEPFDVRSLHLVRRAPRNVRQS